MSFSKIVRLLYIIVFSCLAVVFVANPTLARSRYSFSVSPMNQSITLAPGEIYTGSFRVTNPSDNIENFSYTIERRSFYVDEQYNTVYDEENDAIVDWTRITSNETGVLAPNESAEVTFEIAVPIDASVGGHYEAFRVMSQAKDINDGKTGGATVKERLVITHLLFAEVPGDVVRQGEIKNINVPVFLFDGDIYGESSIKNTGNIHDRAKYALQVFLLFSDEEFYTNEENPETRIILPNRTLDNKNVWDETPAVGIFKVVYTVEFAEETAQIQKIVIKCPLWLLFIIVIISVVVVVGLVLHIKSKIKRRAKQG